MTGEYQADLKNIAQKLKVIHDELLHLELATGAPCLQQAALSAAKALAWCDLVDMISNLPDQRHTPPLASAKTRPYDRE
jgi:hypothetical protein